MNCKWTVTLAAAMLTVLSIASANASESGVYIGASAGQSGIKDQTDNPSGAGTVSLDATDTAYKGFVGYRFAWLPIIDLAVEASYNDFGKPSQTSAGQNLNYTLRGETAAGLLILPLGPLDLYGKAGALYWTVDKNIGGTSSSKTGTNPFYGAGIGFRVWKLGVRAEYEYYDVPNLDRVQMYSAGVLFQF